MKIGVPKETYPGEKRVATTPDAAQQIIKLGFSVCVESGAGAAADISDDAYRSAGVEILPDANSVWSSSDIIMKVRAPEQSVDVNEVDLFTSGKTLVSFIWPAQNAPLMEQLATKAAMCWRWTVFPGFPAHKSWMP